MRIQHNIMAMSAYRNYTNNVSAMKKNLEKLSSGYKINRAGDDAAGLAISEKMRAQITGLETAQKNAKDGISLVQTAEGALTEVHDMLNRMVELASMSANGTYDNTTDRKQLQKEMDQLTAEINRIADSSNFNGINLLDGSMQQGGGGSTINGIDRIISQVLAAGEDPIDLTGERTILDSGSGSSQATKFDVDLTGLKGVGVVDTPTTPPDTTTTVTASTDATKTFNGTNPQDAVGASVTFTVAGASTTYTIDDGNTKLGAATKNQVQIDIGTTTVGALATAQDNNGDALTTNYNVTVKDAAGNVITDATHVFAAGDTITVTAKDGTAVTDANVIDSPASTNATTATTIGSGGTTVQIAAGVTQVADLAAATAGGTATLEDLFEITVNGVAKAWDSTDVIDDGDEIVLTAKAKGVNNTLAATDVVSNEKGTATVDKGQDQGGAPAATKATYEFDVDISKFQGGQKISLGDKSFTVSADAGTSDATKLYLGGLTDAEIAADLKTTLEAAFTDFGATVTDNGNGTLSVKMEATAAGTAANQGAIRVETGTGDSPIGTVDYTRGADAGTGIAAKMAQATFEDNALKFDNLKKVGTEITIGNKTVKVVESGAKATNGEINTADVNATNLSKLFEDLGVNVDGKITFADGSVKIVAKDSGVLTDDAMKALKGTKVEIKSVPADPAPDTTSVKFDFKLGGEVLATDVDVHESATSKDIATAIFNKLTDGDANTDGTQVTINGAKYTVTNGTDGKLSFELVDNPTADNIKGNFDWDVIAPEGKFKGNHTAGTTVIQQGQVGASNAIANTVFRIEKGDIQDGAKITVNGNTVTLAVGEKSMVSGTDKSGNAVNNIIDLRDLDPDNITDADLNTALGKIANAFKGDAGFVVGVNDQANGDTHTGLTVHKREGNTNVYDTKEKLAAVFSMTAPGTGRALTLQIGDTADSYNQLKVDIQDMHASSLGLDGVKISDQESAAAAIDKIKAAINTVSDVRGTLGATQNRLDHTINNLSVMTENIQDAESSIRDVDVAEEMMAYTKNNILIQSAQAMLAQANQVPQGVLQLLQ